MAGERVDQGDGTDVCPGHAVDLRASPHPDLYVMPTTAPITGFMCLEAMARAWPRVRNARIGTTLTDPDIDFATVAKGFGVYAEDRSGSQRSGPALARAVAIVEAGNRPWST